MRLLRLLPVLFFATNVALFCSGGEPATVSQVSRLSSLMEGQYDGLVPLGELRRLGDFGMGAWDKVDGEMIAVDGHFFRADATGAVNEVTAAETKVPFATMVPFVAEQTIEIPAGLSLAQLTALLDERLPRRDVFYALRFEGDFAALRARSVPAQTPPYLPLVPILQRQPGFELKNFAGTLVGFRSPAWAQGLNQAGYHFHFLTGDRLHGGHVLTLTTAAGRLQAQAFPRWLLILETPPVK